MCSLLLHLPTPVSLICELILPHNYDTRFSLFCFITVNIISGQGYNVIILAMYFVEDMMQILQQKLEVKSYEVYITTWSHCENILRS